MSKAFLADAGARAPGATPAGAAWLRLALALSLGLALGLQACQPPAAPVAPTASSPSAASQLRGSNASWAALEQIERRDIALPRQDAQALLNLLEQLPAGSAERLEALSLRSILLANLGDRSGLDQILHELEQWPKEALRPAAQLAAKLARATQFSKNGELAAASQALAGLDAYRPGPVETGLLWRAQLRLAKTMGDRGEMDEAINGGLAALKLAERMDSHWRRAATLGNLSFSYFRAQQQERAIATDAQALAEAQQDPDPVTLNSVYTSRFIVYAEQGDGRVALEAHAHALAAARTMKSDTLVSLALGNSADYHLKRGNYAKALQLSQESLELARQTHDVAAETLARHNAGIAKIGMHRLEEGKREVMQAIAMDEQREATTYAADGWLELGEYLERFADLGGAIQAYHQARRLSDLVLREENRKAVLEAQARYDDEQRAKEIALLNHDNSLKEEQITARDLQLKLWGALGGCVLVSAALLSLAYRRVRKTNLALKNTNESLRIQSERDPLTGLANRRHFQAAIKLLADQGRLAGTVFLIDIDHFKRVNDVHGHAAGDSVLIEVAKRLRHTLREQDLVVRWGGEEFLIVVASRAAEDARLLAQRLLNQIGQQAVQHGSQAIGVTASIGFASFPLAPHNLAVNWERAIDLVDTVMYMAKAHGRNRAYGIESMEASDEDSLQDLAGRMEAAWHEGRVQLCSLQGPQAEEAA